jgi:hypothetical protein
MNVFANHEAKYIVHSEKRKPHLKIADLDARGWPLIVSCDYVSDPLVSPDGKIKPYGITYTISKKKRIGKNQ